MEIREGGLDEPQVIELLRFHLAGMHTHSPAESVHALDLSGLKQPAVTFFTAWDDGKLLRSSLPGFVRGVLMAACAAPPRPAELTVVVAPAASTPAEAPPPAPIEEVVPGVGLAGLALGPLTRAAVVDKLGPPSEIIDHARYTVELAYASGLHVFFCHDDPRERVILLRADAPMRARSREGITRGRSTVSDVLRLHTGSHLSVPPEGRGFVETPGLLYEFDLLAGEAQRPFDTQAMHGRTIKSMSVVSPGSGLFNCPPEESGG